MTRHLGAGVEPTSRTHLSPAGLAPGWESRPEEEEDKVLGTDTTAWLCPQPYQHPLSPHVLGDQKLRPSLPPESFSLGPAPASVLLGKRWPTQSVTEEGLAGEH